MKHRKLETSRLRRASTRSLTPAFTRIATLGALLLLTACTVLPRVEPVDTYLLPSASLSRAEGKASLPVSLRISRPIGGVQLSGQRIVVVPEDNRVSVYKGANWSDPAPVLLRDRILEAFRVDARIAALSSDEQRLHADYELVSELQAFQSEYRDGAPEVVLRLDAHLVQREGRRILASRVFASRLRPASAELTQVVASFGQASSAVASEMVGWVVQVLEPCAAAGCPK